MEFPVVRGLSYRALLKQEIRLNATNPAIVTHMYIVHHVVIVYITLSIHHYNISFYKNCQNNSCFVLIHVFMNTSTKILNQCYLVVNWILQNLNQDISISLIYVELNQNANIFTQQMQTFSFKKMHFKILSAKWQPFCSGLCVLIQKDLTPMHWCFISFARIHQCCIHDEFIHRVKIIRILYH